MTGQHARPGGDDIPARMQPPRPVRLTGGRWKHPPRVWIVETRPDVPEDDDTSDDEEAPR
jgi:hypothetical protein